MSINFTKSLLTTSFAVMAFTTAAHAAVPLSAKCEYSKEGFWHKDTRLSLTVDTILDQFTSRFGNSPNCRTEFNNIINEIASGKTASSAHVFWCHPTLPDYKRYDVTITAALKFGGQRILATNLWGADVAKKFYTFDVPAALRSKASVACPSSGNDTVTVIPNPIIPKPPIKPTPTVDITKIYYDTVNPIRASSTYNGQYYVTGTYEKWSTCIERVIKSELADPLNDCRSKPESSKQSCADTAVVLFKRETIKKCPLIISTNPQPPVVNPKPPVVNPPEPPKPPKYTCIGFDGAGPNDSMTQRATDYANALKLKTVDWLHADELCDRQKKPYLDALKGELGIMGAPRDSVYNQRGYFAQINVGLGRYCGFESAQSLRNKHAEGIAIATQVLAARKCPVKPKPQPLNCNVATNNYYAQILGKAISYPSPPRTPSTALIHRCNYYLDKAKEKAACIGVAEYCNSESTEQCMGGNRNAIVSFAKLQVGQLTGPDTAYRRCLSGHLPPPRWYQ